MNLPETGLFPKNTKNPRWTVYRSGEVKEYNKELHGKYFWWPHAITFVNSERGIAGHGEAMFDLSYKASQRFKLLKSRGWYNSGPVIDKKCFVFRKKVGGQPSDFRIAVTYHGDMYIWVSTTQENVTLDKADHFLNILEMVM